MILPLKTHLDFVDTFAAWVYLSLRNIGSSGALSNTCICFHVFSGTLSNTCICSRIRGGVACWHNPSRWEMSRPRPIERRLKDYRLTLKHVIM